jgi:hypothetical protein
MQLLLGYIWPLTIISEFVLLSMVIIWILGFSKLKTSVLGALHHYNAFVNEI